MVVKHISIDFVDRNHPVIQAYADVFGRERDIKFKVGDILKQPRGSFVSPANCYGNMDGGIDLAYNDFFKEIDLESKIQTYINEFHGGKLEFGTAQIIPTNDQAHPYVIFSPTVERPGMVSSPSNVQNAMYAIIKEAYEFNKKFEEGNEMIIDHLLIPGLGTGYGNLSERESAISARMGYKKAIEEIFDKNQR